MLHFHSECISVQLLSKMNPSCFFSIKKKNTSKTRKEAVLPEPGSFLHFGRLCVFVTVFQPIWCFLHFLPPIFFLSNYLSHLCFRFPAPLPVLSPPERDYLSPQLVSPVCHYHCKVRLLSYTEFTLPRVCLLRF